MAHGWDVHGRFSAKRMDMGREAPQKFAEKSVSVL